MSDFHGLPTYVVENEHLHVEVLATAGPRIVRLMPSGSSANMLMEQPHKNWPTPNGTFNIRGGHRLWHAPELFPRTYHPDNEGLTITGLLDGAALHGPVEAGTGIRKTMTLRLEAGSPRLHVRHELTNEGAWAVELAPWAITQVPLGGVALLPLAGPPLENNLLPDRHIGLWAYTRLDDPRLRLGDDLISIEGRADLPPTKVGIFARLGWIAYLRDELLLIKRFTPQPGRAHPDNGCNIECYTDELNLEIETIAPLERLEPGQSATHEETWEVRRVEGAAGDHAGARLAFAAIGG
jgi:Domain of unknown function (DUF4380)